MSTPVATDTAVSADYASACEALERELVEYQSLDRYAVPENDTARLIDFVHTDVLGAFWRAHGRMPTIDLADIKEKARLLNESRAATREDRV